MADYVTVRLDEYKMNRAAQKAILNSGGVQGVLRQKGEQVRGRASTMYGASKYGVRVRAGKSRAHAFVYTGDRYAMRSNAKHNTLQKALR